MIHVYLLVGGLLGVVNTMHLLWYCNGLRRLSSGYGDGFTVHKRNTQGGNENMSRAWELIKLCILLQRRRMKFGDETGINLLIWISVLHDREYQTISIRVNS